LVKPLTTSFTRIGLTLNSPSHEPLFHQSPRPKAFTLHIHNKVPQKRPALGGYLVWLVKIELEESLILDSGFGTRTTMGSRTGPGSGISIGPSFET